MNLERRAAEDAGRSPRARAALTVFLGALVLATLGFMALGLWQLQRLQWKLALIERVEARIHAEPEAAPDSAEWPRISAATHEYRRVRLQGRFLAGHDIRVQAATVLGSGFWLLSPLQTADGAIVLVNRGFVPSDWRGDAATAVTEVTGLLRLSEPGGAFLRRNDPAAGRWYSRDVAAIAAAQGLHNVAPYFVDAEARVEKAASTAAIPSATAGVTLGPDAGWPRPGLTVVRFRNPHLGYALTWFALALMSAGAAAYVACDARKRR